MQSWWRNGCDTAVESVFGKQGHRVWDAKEACTLVFIVYRRSHFTLLVGYVDEGRCEFYNSMDKDRRSMKHMKRIVSYSIVFVVLLDSLCFFGKHQVSSVNDRVF